ncbi:hypothetical protein AAHA92_17388 [Salvia divinorum]|uniref:Uncharacterized protein n=1 Tax=Salvia divinorum TaxID=28513 RepID=A0ABD1GYM5_SALDI
MATGASPLSLSRLTPATTAAAVRVAASPSDRICCLRRSASSVAVPATLPAVSLHQAPIELRRLALGLLGRRRVIDRDVVDEKS